MPHSGGLSGASLVPDISSGLNALFVGIRSKQTQDREDAKRAEAGGLISQLNAPGVTNKNEEKTLLRLAQLLSPQQLQSVQSILDRGDAKELAAFQTESDQALKDATFLRGLSATERPSAINNMIKKLQAESALLPQDQRGSINQRINGLIELGRLSKGQQDVKIFGQIVQATDIKNLAGFAKARRERQEVTKQERTDQIARDSFLVSQLPVEEQAPFLIEKIFEGERRGENVDHLKVLQSQSPQNRAAQAQANINQARKLEDIVKPPKQTVVSPGQTIVEDGDVVFTAPAKPAVVKPSVVNPKNLTSDGFLIENLGEGKFRKTKVLGIREIDNNKQATGQTNIYKNGTIINALKNGRSQVINPAGEDVKGDDRLKVLKEANANELALARATAGEKAAGTQAINQSTKAFEQISNLKKSVVTIDRAIEALDKGAGTGPIISKLPSIRNASILLDQIQGQMGLDVLRTTTFGSLSASELSFALSTSLPVNLPPKELRKWLVEKKMAMLKLADYLQDVAIFLGTPGNTVAGWLETQRAIADEFGIEPESSLTAEQKRRLEQLRQKQRNQ